MKQLIQICILQVCLAWSYISTAQVQVTKIDTSPTSVATTWADMTVRVMTKAQKNTPTYGSRAVGYLGLTMYETIVHSSPKNRSILRQLVDTLSLPNVDPKKLYCWELALNAGQAYMLKVLYAYTEKTKPIDSLEQVIHTKYATQYSRDVVERSEEYGKTVAAKIYQWSKSDGGHEGYLRNFPVDYVRPTGTGLWVPPVIGQSNTKIPMHPAWGKNRTFSRKNRELPLPKPLEYSTDTTSLYYRHYKEVVDRKVNLTNAERATVMWWGDDPTETCSPPGHSYNLGTIAIRTANADLMKAAETYARVGMAVADAFITCWKVKFTYNVERPSSYAQTVIRADGKDGNWWPQWLPYFLEPPFPSFYSGHAVQSAATATVLTELYGNSFSFTDDTHVNRPELRAVTRKELPNKPTQADYTAYFNLIPYTVKYEPRHYKSFWTAAQECAESRLMGGIHTRHDNEVGLVEGVKIGGNINALLWH